MWKIILLFTLSFCVFAHGEGDVLLGGDCDYQEDCEHIEHAICNSYDNCECEERYVSSPEKSACLPLAAAIGDKCEIDEQCYEISSSAHCVDEICTASQATTTPPPPPPPPQSQPKVECTEDSQCGSFIVNKVCKNGTCVIALPPISPKSIGIDSFFLGKPCRNSEECTGEGVACTDNLCKCIESFVPAQNLKKCLPKAISVGDSCVETAQCLALNGSVCEKEKCTEKVMKFLTNVAEKIPSLIIGSTCQTDNECKHLTHALCIENVCQCKDGYVTSLASNVCLEKVKKEGDPCEIDKQCEDIKGATCLKNKCVKPGVVGTKLGNQNSGTTKTVSNLLLGAILFTKMLFV